MQREEVHFQAVLLRGQRRISFRRSFLPLFPPPLPEAGRRRGLPGSAARARAGSEGSARQLGPRRGALGRGSVNIHEAPPLLRGPPDPGARRSPLCPGPAAHTRARPPRARASAPGGETSGHATGERGLRGSAPRQRRDLPRPAPGSGRRGRARGGAAAAGLSPSPGRAGRGPTLPRPRSPSARLAGPAGARAASRGRTARAFLLDPPPSTPPPSPPLPGDARGRGVFGLQSPGPESQDRGGRPAETGVVLAGTPSPPQPGHPLALSSPHPDAGHTTPAASREPLWERAQPCSCLRDRSWGTAAPFLQRVGREATGCGASR